MAGVEKRRKSIDDFVDKEDSDRQGVEFALDNLARLDFSDPKANQFMDLFNVSLLNLYKRNVPLDVLEEYKHIYANIMTVMNTYQYLAKRGIDKKT